MAKNKLPDMITKEKLIKLFENILIPKCSIACFMGLMCGLRVNEICTLKVSDVDLEKRTIKIKDSKNPNRKNNQGYGKDRIVPIPECAISPIKKWFNVIEGGKYFLPSEKSPDMPLRKKTIHTWFADARKRSGLNEIDYVIQYKKPTKYRKETTIYKIRFHHLRHYYATYVYEKTRDLYAVSDLLGHNQVSTTQIYAKISDKTKRDTIDFAFNTPIKTRLFEQNPKNALNYSIPEIAKKEKDPLEILDERFARGEISASDYQTALRLLKVRKDYLNQGEKTNEHTRKIEFN